MSAAPTAVKGARAGARQHQGLAVLLVQTLHCGVLAAFKAAVLSSSLHTFRLQAYSSSSSVANSLGFGLPVLLPRQLQQQVLQRALGKLRLARGQAQQEHMTQGWHQRCQLLILPCRCCAPAATPALQTAAQAWPGHPQGPCRHPSRSAACTCTSAQSCSTTLRCSAGLRAQQGATSAACRHPSAPAAHSGAQCRPGLSACLTRCSVRAMAMRSSWLAAVAWAIQVRCCS